MIRHPFGVAGLMLNTIGASLLIFFQPGAPMVRADGGITMAYAGQMHALPTLALIALAAGFLLQLVDLIRS